MLGETPIESGVTNTACRAGDAFTRHSDAYESTFQRSASRSTNLPGKSSTCHLVQQIKQPPPCCSLGSNTEMKLLQTFSRTVSECASQKSLNGSSMINTSVGKPAIEPCTPAQRYEPHHLEMITLSHRSIVLSLSSWESNRSDSSTPSRQAAFRRSRPGLFRRNA